MKMSQCVTAISLKVNEIFYFLEWKPSSSFSGNHEENERDQANENLPDNKNEGNQTNTRSKSTIDTRFYCLYD